MEIIEIFDVCPGEIYLYLVGACAEWRHRVSYYDSVVFDSRASKKGNCALLFWFKITSIRRRVFSRCRLDCCVQCACQCF